MVVKNLLFAEVLTFGPIHGISLCKGTEGTNECELYQIMMWGYIRSFILYSFLKITQFHLWRQSKRNINGLVSNEKGDQGALFQIKSWLQFGHAAQPASFFEWVQKWSSFPRKNTMQQSSNTLHMFFLTHSKAFSPSLHTNPGVFDRLISPRKNPLWNYQTPSHQFYNY